MKKVKANKYGVCKTCDYNNNGICNLLKTGSTCIVRRKKKMVENYKTLIEMFS